MIPPYVLVDVANPRRETPTAYRPATPSTGTALSNFASMAGGEAATIVEGGVLRDLVSVGMRDAVTTADYRGLGSSRRVPDLFQSAFAELYDLATSGLPDGDDSEVPSATALSGANGAISTLRDLDLLPSRILRSVLGGVTVCFVRGKLYASVDFFNTGEVVAATAERGQPPETWEVVGEPDAMRDALAKLRDFLESDAS